MASAAEPIARTLGLQQTTPEILTASAQISRQILGTDSTFMAVADGTRLLGKLNASSRLEAVVRATDTGLI
jgi:hypothetical protein